MGNGGKQKSKITYNRIGFHLTKGNMTHPFADLGVIPYDSRLMNNINKISPFI